MTKYRFICENDVGTNTNIELVFSVPEDGVHVGTFQEMAARAARAFGYADSSVDSYFPQGEHNPFEEFI